jgi:hypothetical protein
MLRRVIFLLAFFASAGEVLRGRRGGAHVGSIILAEAARPLALHFAVNVSANSENVVAFRLYDSDGDDLTTSVTSFPPSGTLSQLSHVFSSYGYEPKVGEAFSHADIVTGSGARVIYSPPANVAAPDDSWGHIEYSTADVSSGSLIKGVVALLGPEGNLVASNFDRSSEGWAIKWNGAGGVGITYEASSRGELNHFISSKDDEVNRNAEGRDTKLWYFVAPMKFRFGSAKNPTGSLAYGGALRFTMGSHAGDFSKDNANSEMLDLVYISCATCDSGRGINMVHRVSASEFTGSTKKFEIPILESSWLKDPKNTLFKWKKPTACEVIEVFDGLSELRILGDFTRWFESVSLDSVNIRAGVGGVPLSCYNTLASAQNFVV